MDVWKRSGYWRRSEGCNKLVEYVCLNAVLVEFSLTRGICGQGLIRTRLGYHEESGSSSPGDNIGIHGHC